jgi:uncharacterized protein DUF4124
MSGGDLSKSLTVVFIGLTLALSSTAAHATVYLWKNEKGVLNLGNDLDDVPEAQRAAAEKFTSKFAGKSTPEGTGPVTLPDPESEPISLYERGLERGLQTAERQVALAGELARTVLTAMPPAPPTRIIIQQPAPTIIRYASPQYYTPPFYGFIGPYMPYSPYGFNYGYSYGFGYGRFVPHSHFFPGTRGVRGGLFFPHGHFSQDGFLFGHGFVVR